jgi:hypothetical protein
LATALKESQNAALVVGAAMGHWIFIPAIEDSEYKQTSATIIFLIIFTILKFLVIVEGYLTV